MGYISSYSKNEFISGDEIYSKILREWKSFSGTNAIDAGEFPTYTAEILHRLGMSALKEEQAIIKVNDAYVAALPPDFRELYAAYKCSPSFSDHEQIYPQQTVKMWMDVECGLYSHNKNCNINCCNVNDSLIEKIEMRTFIGTDERVTNFLNPILLRLSPNVSPEKCHNDCKNLLYSSPFEITITDHNIITNFKDDCIFLKYYATPMDEHWNPMIPDIEEVKKAVEWWIKYNITLNFFFNQDVADIGNKWQKAEAEYRHWFAEAKYLLKLPSFAELVNSVRNKRAINKVSFFSQMDTRGYNNIINPRGY